MKKNKKRVRRVGGDKEVGDRKTWSLNVLWNEW